MKNLKLTEKRKEIVKAMNFDSSISVLRYYPYRYDHFHVEPLSFSMHDKKVTFEGKVFGKVKFERISNGRNKTSFLLVNNSQQVKVILFNKFATTKIFNENANVVVSGKYNAFVNEISVSTFFLGSLNNQEKFNSIYSLPSNIKDHTYRSFVKYIYDNLLSTKGINTFIPEEFIEKYKLVDLKTALYNIHFPTTSEDLRQANRFLKYEEFLTFCVMGSLKRKLYSLSCGIKRKNVDLVFVNRFIKSLPFKLTDDQYNCVKEILKDLNSINTMSRLLQGDVGSGKTIVALIALIANYSANYQGALMAPTDILAKQHYESIKKLLSDYSDIDITLLVSDMKAKDKKEALKKISSNKANIIIGTHSLIQENVSYANLGLAIVDEQHRFGVKQRLALKDKGKQIDVLYMSATPIPRTLASTIYMDMDVSTIEVYPYSERKINTYYIKENSIKNVKPFLNQYLSTGQKIYVVCPSIEESTLDISNVNEIYQSYKKQFKDYNIGLLHGKLTAEEKNEVMDKFDKGEYQVLISTTVIEVGINVLDANMIIIYNAERFGLAQIHQLRGRVARDGKTGYCYLLSPSLEQDVNERLSFIESSNDGFKISEFDLKRRGAGDMLGLAQSGKSPFTIANLIDDFNILKQASLDASYIMQNSKKYEGFINYIREILHTAEKYVD